NLEGLIEAIHFLPMKYKKQIKIDYYGRKEGSEKIVQQSVKKIQEYHLEDIVKLNDATSAIFEKYQRADFVALVSHHEGFPNTICEAMALKKPVIVSRVSDIPLLIKEDINGFLCESKDIHSIKEAFIKAIGSTQEQRQ